ncbi:hypothetical protein [Actinoplanes sp. NPDC026619]|uniref:hypothetical protein n=1 Tax=Actinoplanes sp. NPDC026619 TaxID=3155798 RepID=UPI0033C01AE5
MDQIGSRALRPPQVWETQTLALMAAVAFAAQLAILLMVSELAVRSYLLDEAPRR